MSRNDRQQHDNQLNNQHQNDQRQHGGHHGHHHGHAQEQHPASWSDAGERYLKNRPRILVDAANVAFFNRDRPDARASVANLEAMRRHLESMGYQPIFIADAALKYKVDDERRLDHLEQDGKILQAPAATEADYFLLAYSARENLPIVSNDVYRDRDEEFPEAVQRRVPFMIVEGTVIIDREKLSEVENGDQQRGPNRSAAADRDRPGPGRPRRDHPIQALGRREQGHRQAAGHG